MTKIFRTVEIYKTHLIEGDPLDPSEYDLLAVNGRLGRGHRVPNNFRVITGNTTDSQVVGIFTRGELEAETKWL